MQRIDWSGWARRMCLTNKRNSWLDMGRDDPGLVMDRANGGEGARIRTSDDGVVEHFDFQ